MILPPVVRTIRFEIPTAPRPNRRAETSAFMVRLDSGKAIPRSRMHEHPETARDKANVVALAAPHAPAEPWQGPFLLSLTFVREIPAGFPVWKREAAEAGLVLPTTKPDFDNFEKLVLDALTKTKRWWLDDSQWCGYLEPPLKVYGRVPRTEVAIHLLEDMTRESWIAHKTNGTRPGFAAFGRDGTQVAPPGPDAGNRPRAVNVDETRPT